MILAMLFRYPPAKPDDHPKSNPLNRKRVVVIIAIRRLAGHSCTVLAGTESWNKWGLGQLSKSTFNKKRWFKKKSYLANFWAFCSLHRARGKLHQRRPQTVGEITHIFFSLPAVTLSYRKKKPATMLEHWALLSSEWVKCCMLNAKEQWWHKIGHLWNHRLQIVQSMTTSRKAKPQWHYNKIRFKSMALNLKTRWRCWSHVQ